MATERRAEWTDAHGNPFERTLTDRLMSHTDPRYWPGVRWLWWRFNRSTRSRIALCSFVAGGLASWLIR